MIRRRTVKATQNLLLGLLIVGALYVSIGRILVGSLDSFRASITSFAIEQLKVPVRIGKLSGSWSYLNPTFNMQALEIGEPANPSIRLGKVQFTLDSFYSLIELSPIITNINVSGVALTLRRNELGTWLIEGIPQRDAPLNLEMLVDSIEFIEFAELNEVDVVIYGQTGIYNIHSESDKSFLLANQDGKRKLSWPLVFEAVDRPKAPKSNFHLLGFYQGDPRDEDFLAELYLQIPNIDVTDFLPTIAIKEATLTDIDIHGELWLTVHDELIEVTGRPTIGSVVMSSQTQSLQLLRDTTIEFIATNALGSGGELKIGSLSAWIAEQNVELSAFGLSYKWINDELVFGANIPSINIGSIVPPLITAAEKMRLVTPALTDVVETLNAQGYLNNVFVHGNLSRPEGIAITTELSSISVDPFKGAPAVANLHGYASLGLKSGTFVLNSDLESDNQNGFVLDFPLMFPDAWQFDSVKAKINYKVTDEAVLLQSGLIEAVQGEMTAAGRFMLNFPSDITLHTWGFELGVKNAALLNTYDYLPKTLPAELQAWIKDSVLAGTAIESGLIFHGSLASVTPKDQKAFELYFDVEDTILDYDPRWPRFEDVNAIIYVGNRQVHSKQVRAVAMDSVVQSAEVRVPVTAAGADTLIVNGSFTGPFSDGLRLLTETPLYEATSEVAKGWQGRGEMSGSVQLNIPLGSRSGEDAHAQLDLNLVDSDVYIPDLNLDIVQLNGPIRYESFDGLSSNGFTANIFDKPVSGSIDTLGIYTSGVIEINVDGEVTIGSLYDWTEQVLLTRAMGELDYSAQLKIPFGDKQDQPVSIKFASNLEGVEIMLPEPLGKVYESTKNFSYRHDILDAGFDLEVQLGRYTQAHLKILDGDVTGGRLHFGESAIGAVTYDHLDISGDLAAVVYEEVEILTDELNELASGSLETGLVDTLGEANIRISFLDVYGLELEDIQTIVSRDADSWVVEAKNEMLFGKITGHDVSSLPLEVELETLNFETQDGDQSDPLEFVDPVDLIAVDFSVQKMWVDEEDYGSWAFDFRPTANGAELNNLTVSTKGLEASGDGRVDWFVIDGVHKSRFTGKVFVPDMSSALSQWGLASSIYGQFELDAGLSWVGSPAMFDLNSSVGTVELEQASGRFVQADNNVDALKLLGIFDFASIARRFRFDFTDVVDKGFEFDEAKGKVRLSEGQINVVEPITIVGTGSKFKLAGDINMIQGDLDNDLIVTLPINRNIPWYAAYSAIFIGPLTGASVYLAQRIFADQIDTLSSAKYHIAGSVENPSIEFVSIFSDTVRDSTAVDEALPQPESHNRLDEESPTDSAEDFENSEP
jgi:uncharacterized protein (TIGR02099 family)